MRIGFFTSIGGWGGSENYLKSLVLGVRETGHEVVLFGVAGSRLFRELSAADVPCVAWQDGWHGGEDAAEQEESDGASVWPSSVTTSSYSSLLRRAWRAWVPGGVKLLAGTWREARFLRRVFERDRVDVMHVNVHGYETAGMACRWAAIPCVGVACNKTLP